MTESAAEKRARLRRMKILVDSERRLNRIIDGNSQQIPNEIPSIDSNCDIDQQTNQSQDSGKISNLVNCRNQDQPAAAATTTTTNQSQFESNNNKNSCNTRQSRTANHVPTPRQTEPFPRKVSLISSPIHYKTLQLSKQYHSMLNHPNIINNLRCNSSQKLMLILVLFAFIGSCFNLNIPMLFISYFSVKQAYNGIYKRVWFENLTTFNVMKELFTFIFSYIRVLVTIKIISN